MAALIRGVENEEDNNVGPGDVSWDDIDDEILFMAENSIIPAAAQNDRMLVAAVPPFKSYTESGYICVTDVTSQRWCEQKIVYMRTLPDLKVVEKPAMTAGSNIHLQRELEVHDTVPVKVVTKEDKWAVKLLNLTQSIIAFLSGEKIAREVPVFGEPFNEGILINGIIDEIRFCPNEYTIDISELKTRFRRDIPNNAQREQHNIQMRLYKKLFDDMVCGRVDKRRFAEKVVLDLNARFSDEISSHLQLLGDDVTNLSQLWDFTMNRMQSLTKVSNLYIEYVHQETRETIRHVTVDYNEVEFRAEFVEFMKFWKGLRRPNGVDIEEAWKCGGCEYYEVCEWRKTKNDEILARKKGECQER